MVKRTLIGVVEACEPLIWQALEAIRQTDETDAASFPSV